MIKIMTAINNPNLNEELKRENNVEVIARDIQYKEGILEILENNEKINYIIIDEKLPGEIELKELIEKILEKNEEIKIIITIKKENKNNIKFNNKKIIEIFYEDKINLNKLKNYNNNIKKENVKKGHKNKKEKILKNKINVKNIYNKLNISNIYKKINVKKYFIKNNKEKNKNKKTKIITILGETKVGKSMTIINFAYFLKNKNSKILIIELNNENVNLYTIFGCKKNNRIIRKKQIKIKNNCSKLKRNFKQKNINRKIIENQIVKINKNIDLISYSKLLNFNAIKKIVNNYNYLLIENYSKKNKEINKKIIMNSDENILLIKPNLLGIKNGKKIIEKNNLNTINNLKIIINNYNKNSINEKIIEKIFYEKEIIGKIKYRVEYESLLNNNFKNIILVSKSLKKETKKIINKII